jgi:hypothetical protein
MNTENQVVPLIAFVHIPKAGGMSLTRLLEETYGGRLLIAHPQIGWPQTFSTSIMADIASKRLFYEAFIGHFAYGIHTVFERKTRYFSVVRDPLDRLESYYNFVKRWNIHHHYQRAQELDMNSFFSYLIDVNDIELSNLQCLMIAGDQDPDLALRRADEDFELIIPLSNVNNGGVGLLCKKLNIGHREMPEVNTTSHASKMNSLRKSVYDKLVELNQGDARLYRQVCEKFGTLVT